MTKDEALKLAHGALKKFHYAMIDAGVLDRQEVLNEGFTAATAIKEALALPEQEPVAWLSKGGKGIWFHEPDASLNATHLYITPPQRKPLTDEEIADLWSAQIFHINDLKLAKDFVRDIEAAHGIKE